MNKKTLFSAISVLSAIIFFSIAAICNQCSIPQQQAVRETVQEADREGDAVTPPPEAETDGQTPDTAEDTEPAPEGENSLPVMDEIELFGWDIEYILESDGLDVVPAEAEFYFKIEAHDDDGDELAYKASDDRGNNYEVTKIDNEQAEFYWLIPAEEGPIILTFEVEDGKGGVASYALSTSIVQFEEEGVDDFVEPEEEAYSEDIVSIVPTPAYSGHIVQDEGVFLASESTGTYLIYVGDTLTHKASKGYLSFSIRDLWGTTVLDTEINITSLHRLGDPSAFADNLDVKDYYFGTLDMGDYAVGGTRLALIPVSSSSYNIGGDALLTAVQTAIDGRRNYYQIKLGLTGTSDGDDQFDGFEILLSEVGLYINYTD